MQVSYMGEISDQRGFIFLWTLVLFSIISLLVLTSMGHVLLYHKAINNQELQHQHFYQLEDIARQLGQRPLSSLDKRCLLQGDEANQVFGQLAQHKGCLLHIKQIPYYYLIEDLGSFPCLISKKDNQINSTHHLRLSIISAADVTSVLQVRLIKASSNSEACPFSPKVIRLGISSWRYIADASMYRKVSSL